MLTRKAIETKESEHAGTAVSSQICLYVTSTEAKAEGEPVATRSNQDCLAYDIGIGCQLTNSRPLYFLVACSSNEMRLVVNSRFDRLKQQQFEYSGYLSPVHNGMDRTALLLSLWKVKLKRRDSDGNKD